MSKSAKLWIAWGCLYLLCTACAFLSVTPGFFYALFIAFSIAFFVPGGMLLHHGITTGDKTLVRIIRLMSLCSLGLTLVTIILNFLTARHSAAVGTVLYWLLILVSTPMICSQVWVLGLFGWACLLMASLFCNKK